MMVRTAPPRRHQRAKTWSPERGRPFTKEFIRSGVDLAKNNFQVHALESEDGRATRSAAMRKSFLGTTPRLVGMETSFSRAAFVVEGNDIFGRRRHVGDNEADA